MAVVGVECDPGAMFCLSGCLALAVGVGVKRAP